MCGVRESKGAMESWREDGVLAIPQGGSRQFGGACLRTQICPTVGQDKEQFRNPPLIISDPFSDLMAAPYIRTQCM